MLEIISDKNKFQEDIVKKVSNYQYSYKADPQYLRENYKEFIEYNTFISDPSKPYGGHKTRFQNWVLAYNNVLVAKELGYYRNFYSSQEYGIKQCGSFGYQLSNIKEEVDIYIENNKCTNLKINIINMDISEKNDAQFNERPYSLLALAKAAVVKAAVRNRE